MVPPKPDPVAVLNAWLSLEALQPQAADSQEALVKPEPPRRRRRGRAHDPAPVPAQLQVPFDLESGVMPWETSVGDRKVLGLEPQQGIRWFIPLGFVRLKPAVEMMVRGLEPDGPERERARGVAVLALACFDERGFAVPSQLRLSSFGWACGQVLAGRIEDLHRYLDIEDDLRREIADPLVERGENGLIVPATRKGFTQSMMALMKRLALPPEVLERPRIAIRVIGDVEKEPVDIINSFFLDDLHRVRTALGEGDGGSVLRAYLGDRPSARRDVLAEKELLETLIAPARFPPARWPAPHPAKLVTLQQAAVNAAMRDLADGGLLSINGPPGTGKTTLLRDVIAAVIVERAEALMAFEQPDAAFEPVELVAEAGQRKTLYALDSRLRGHGIVVASSNNSAVRNVSAELPLAKAVASELDLGHFAGTADFVQSKPGSCWGLIAAVLGNRRNRIDFVESAWWDEEWGLERYFGAVTGRVAKGKADRPPSLIVEAEQPPTRPAQAAERWRLARLEFQAKCLEVERLTLEREQVRTAFGGAGAAQQALENAQKTWADAVQDADDAAAALSARSQALATAREGVTRAQELERGSLAARPGGVRRFLGLDEKWRQNHLANLAHLRKALANLETVEGEERAAVARLTAAQEELARAEAELTEASNALAWLRDVEGRSPDICGSHQAGPAFWSQDHEAVHKASPWADGAFTAARDALFKAALNLHRAFIDAAGHAMKTNLGLFMDHLKGKRIPSGADRHLGELWDSFFLLVPLVSTTFASFRRLMDGLGEGAIGWLIVDEAGQATPQAAVGALWRARRALIIGDPLQIEPVTQVPTGLVRAICDVHGAHPDEWSAPRASVQTLADLASPLMSRMGSGADVREIGLPLLVHRRCQDPMFSISNAIAYDGLMVHAVAPEPSPIADALAPALPGSCWVDVDAPCPEKYNPMEGEAVLELLRRLAFNGIKEPNLYVITPFREVAEKLRGRIIRSGVLTALGIGMPKQQKNWGDTHVGTVHTFQGKEAEAVILVLGASAAESGGSRSWAGQTPNILNVAATRAKQVLYVVGHHAHWRTAGKFATAANMLPVVRWPLDGLAETRVVRNADPPSETIAEMENADLSHLPGGSI